jgi:predicted N-acetyltransferase YhbS
VYGYSTLIVGQLDHHEAAPETSKGLSQHFPIPVAILARLAVGVDHQSHGIGAALLNDALVRVVRASTQLAVRAVVVHAVDDSASASSFYKRFGFRALADAPTRLMVSLAALREANYE